MTCLGWDRIPVLETHQSVGISTYYGSFNVELARDKGEKLTNERMKLEEMEKKKEMKLKL